MNVVAIRRNIAVINLFFVLSDSFDQKCILKNKIKTTPSPIRMYLGIYLF